MRTDSVTSWTPCFFSFLWLTIATATTVAWQNQVRRGVYACENKSSFKNSGTFSSMTSLDIFFHYANQIHWSFFVWVGFLIWFFNFFLFCLFSLVFFLQSVKEQESKESNQIYSVAFLVRHLCSSLFHIQDIDIGKIDNELCSLRLWLIKLATLLSLAQASGDFNCWVLLWENSAVRQSCNSHHKDPELFQVVTHSSDRWGKNSK